MLLKFAENVKVPLGSILISLFVFFVVFQSSFYWQEQQLLIKQLMYGLLCVNVIFAAYFNRSRFAFLSFLLLLFSVTITEHLPWSTWLNSHDKWLLLFVAFVLSLLSVSKDRGIISVHGINRLFLISFCGLLSWGWLWSTDYISAYSQQYGLPAQWADYIEIELPLLLSVLLITLQSLRTKSLVVAALLVTLLVWSVQYYQLFTLPWHIILVLLAVHYILVVVIDSYLLAYRDELTTLPSRRALNQFVLSLGRKYSVAMVDIDHFKKFNDTYGHDVGDQVLKLIASKLAEVKDRGNVFRYGGEEFTIIFPRKSTEQVMHALETVRQAIASYEIVIRHSPRETKQKRGTKGINTKTISVTISIGVASRARKQTFADVLKIADQALYRAKENGRNNVAT